MKIILVDDQNNLLQSWNVKINSELQNDLIVPSDAVDLMTSLARSELMDSIVNRMRMSREEYLASDEFEKNLTNHFQKAATLAIRNHFDKGLPIHAAINEKFQEINPPNQSTNYQEQGSSDARVDSKLNKSFFEKFKYFFISKFISH